MKKLGSLFLLLGVFSVIMITVLGLKAKYHYEQGYSSYWNLADKASTLSQKSEYIDKFVTALQNSGLQGTNDALIWKTNNNSFDKNFEALKSLQTRLNEIKTLDINSFAYQTAIQQITAQEQGEADTMLNIFSGCWYKVHYYWLWNPWLDALWVVSTLIAFGLGIYFLILRDNY